MSILAGLVESAKEAGASGKRWHDWVMSDEVQDTIAQGTFTSGDQDAIESAFAEGQKKELEKRGRVVWTTAPSDYDIGTTVELEKVGDYHGKPLRKVVMEPEDYQYQTGRYGSGLYLSSDEDPIEADRRAKEKLAAIESERLASEAKHKAGLEWLKTASSSELDNEDLAWERGARWQDVRDERKRRREEEDEKKRTSEWERVRALIPEGATLIDEGEYIPAPMVGLRPIQRPARVYYDVQIESGARDVGSAKVHEKKERGTVSFGSAESIADLISRGKLRVAQKGEVPPRAVVERIGPEHFKKIRAVEVGGRTVWVGRPTFATDFLVLDDAGKLVRTSKIAEAAAEAVRSAEYMNLPPGTLQGKPLASPLREAAEATGLVGPPPRARKMRSVPSRHQARIEQENARMPEAMADVLMPPGTRRG